MRKHNPPPFSDYTPGPDFDRARSQIATPFQYQDFALDTATSNLIVNISGDFLYADASTTGIATVELNNQYNDAAAPFMVQASFALNAEFKQLKLSWASQPGKKLRLMWSTGERVIPALSGSLGISGTVNTAVLATLPEQPQVYGASYKSITAMAANTPDTVFTAAQNVNGAILHRVAFASNQALGNVASYIAKSTAPVNVIDGEIIVGYEAYYGSGLIGGRTEKPIKIASGKGLYYISSGAESAPLMRSVLYTLL